MSNIGERIKQLRKELKLSQTDFGAKLGVGLGVVRNWESSLTSPNRVQIDVITHVYNVNREWLESGEGEIFSPLTRNQKLANFVSEVLNDKPESFRHWLVGVLIELDEDGWQKLEEAVKLFTPPDKG